jgi:hypothetical protein
MALPNGHPIACRALGIRNLRRGERQMMVRLAHDSPGNAGSSEEQPVFADVYQLSGP